MTVTVKMLVDKLKLKVVYGNEELLAKAITTADISRPGLEMTGYFDYYSPERLQLVGMKEWSYLKTMTANNRYSVFANIFRENLVIKKDSILSDDSKVFKIKDVIKYIENNYRNDINITTLANICHYNEYHFMRFFKKYTGKTCIQFIKNYRLEKAYNLLKNTDLPVTQISFDVGFSNVSYFIRSFKEKYKVTPKELRLRADDSFNV